MILNIVLCVFLVTYCLHISYLISFYNIYGYLVSGVSLLFEHLPSIVGPPLLKWGVGPSKNWVIFWGEGYQKFCLKVGITLKRGVTTFLLLYNSIAFTLCVCGGGGVKFAFITF